jgi:MFS family permease
MTIDVSTADRFAGPAEFSQRRLAIGFLNVAHGLDHFVMLIFPMVVIELQAFYGLSYSELIMFGTASFIAFGLFSLPAGWLADRWSRRNMMVAFYIGCGVSLVGAAFAPSLYVLAAALFVLGVFAAIYHPVGTALVLENATHRGRTLAFNGVCGNLGISLAAAITAVLTAAFSWRGAFLVPVSCASQRASPICASCRTRRGMERRAAGRPTSRFRRRRRPRSLAYLSWSRSAPVWYSILSRLRCRRSSTSAPAAISRCS